MGSVVLPAPATAVPSDPVSTALTLVDLTDGSWTILDPGNTITSLAKSGDTMVWTEASFTASADYQLAGTNYLAWLAYRPLVDVNGDAVTSDDLVTHRSAVVMRAPAGTPAQRIVDIGICINPTSTLMASLQPVSGGMYQPSAGAKSGHYQAGGANTYMSGASQSITATDIRLGGGDISSLSTIAFTSAGAYVNKGCVNVNAAYASSAPLYEVVLVACRNNSDAGVSGADIRADIYIAPVVVDSVPT
jgi:hypothetical protein